MEQMIEIVSTAFLITHTHTTTNAHRHAHRLALDNRLYACQLLSATRKREDAYRAFMDKSSPFVHESGHNHDSRDPAFVPFAPPRAIRTDIIGQNDRQDNPGQRWFRDVSA
jgi:hypothetical protein